MALVLPGAVSGEVRGSAGGTTFSRNRFGAYVRNRAVPVNPQSSRQQSVRGHMTVGATSWRDTLTAAQREAWELYAENTAWLNALGQSVYLTGQQHYVRQYVACSLLGRTPATDGPTSFGVPDPPELWTPSISVSSGTLDIAFTASMDTDDLDWIFFQGQPKSPSINFFNGPWRYAGAIEGDGSTAPTSPASLTLQWPVGVGQRVWVYARAIDPEGRLSAKFRKLLAVAS